jgi:hypothetical protein
MLDHMNTSEITIRPEYPDDELALIRLAALDSSEPPARPLLLAEVDGELHAAVSLLDGSSIADPFQPTTAIVDLLRARARTVARPRRTGRRPLVRVPRRVATA